MKTKEELEKLFDENFNLWVTLVQNNFWEHRINNNNEVKQFIFEELLPEVLKSLFVYEDDWQPSWIIWRSIKIDAKRLYNIDL